SVRLVVHTPAQVHSYPYGDRAFLRRTGADPAKFLRVVSDAGADDQTILEHVKRKAAAYTSPYWIPKGGGAVQAA
ncbi:MAG: hypothetical protein VST65_11230, partial [Nitrospirota bacterium]|nr:hypothetical protein [Nitrospirota bacterium]